MFDVSDAASAGLFFRVTFSRNFRRVVYVWLCEIDFPDISQPLIRAKSLYCQLLVHLWHFSSARPKMAGIKLNFIALKLLRS